MRAIMIVGAPPGFAPPHIREEWVGLTIPLASAEEIKTNPPSDFGIGSGNTGGYIVTKHAAIKALELARRYKAAEFWKSISIGYYIEFHRGFCELI